VTSRLAGIGRTKALVSLAALLLFIALNVVMPRWTQGPEPSSQALQTTKSIPPAVERDQDLKLYNAINKRIAEGETYYLVASSEQRANGYPLKPFVTIRLPTLAMIAGITGPIGLNLILWTLIAGTILVWWQRLSADFPTQRHRPIAAFLLGTTIAVRPEMAVMHESWAGILILLSIGLYDPRRWWPSLLTAGLAVAIRETATPYVMLMLALAIFQRRVSEAACWLAVLGAEAAYLAWHAAQVASVVLPDDPRSQGWMLSGGWPFAFDFLNKSSALRMLPDFVAQIVLALTLFGWLAWKQSAGIVAVLLICGYALVFMIAGRPENFYWGMLVGPLLLGGLAFAPRGLLDLWDAIQKR
jgi:hypothetical protein